MLVYRGHPSPFFRIEGALRDLDSLSPAEVRPAKNAFLIVPIIGSPPGTIGTMVASRRLTSGEHLAIAPSRLTRWKKEGDANSVG